MAECIAVVNAGSSSVKFGFYDLGSEQALLIKGQVEQIGVSPTLTAEDAQGNALAKRNWQPEGFGHAHAMHAIIETARALLPGSNIRGVGHRVVHRGTRFAASGQLTPATIPERERPT